MVRLVVVAAAALLAITVPTTALAQRYNERDDVFCVPVPMLNSMRCEVVRRASKSSADTEADFKARQEAKAQDRLERDARRLAKAAAKQAKENPSPVEAVR